MKAIITGSNSFIGRALSAELQANGYEVLCVDRAYGGVEKLLTQDLHGQIDIIYHLAWAGTTGAGRSDIDIQLGNIKMTADLIRYAAKIDCKKVVVTGTIMEFETYEACTANDTKPSASYIYGASKLAAHTFCKPLANSLGVDLIWSYISNAFGPGEHTYARFINMTLRKIINNDRLEFTKGTQNYDFIFISDVVNALRLIGEKGKANRNYMISSGTARPLREFVIELCQLFGREPEFGDVAYTGVETELSVFSNELLKIDCGFTPVISFKDGLKKTYEDLISREDIYD